MINWLQAGIGAVVTALVAFALHKVDIVALQEKQKADLKELAQTLDDKCKADKQITTEVSHAFESQIVDLHRQLDDAKRLRGSQCIIVQPPGDSPEHRPAPQPGQSVKQDGVHAAALLDFAGEAEKYRLQLIGCQSFVQKTWAANGQ